MGLEGVELVMDVEEEFDIKIEDDTAAAMVSIGDLTEYVTQKIHGGSISSFPCMNARAFYIFRRQLLAHLPLQVRQIVPKAKLVDLIPRGKRVSVWEACRDAGLHLPSLHLPMMLFLPVIAGGVALGLLVAIKIHVSAMFVAIFILGASGMWLVERLVRCRELTMLYCFPPGCDTVADLMRYNYPPIDERESRGPIDPSVLKRIKRLVADITGEREENLTLATRFGADLNF